MRSESILDSLRWLTGAVLGDFVRSESIFRTGTTSFSAHGIYGNNYSWSYSSCVATRSG